MPSSTRVDPARITSDDPPYQDLVRRGFNKRFIPRPDHVRLVTDTARTTYRDVFAGALSVRLPGA